MTGIVDLVRIAVGSDHAGYRLKARIAAELLESGHVVLDLGTVNDVDPVDWPDFGEAVARAVVCGEADLGVAVCGSGLGVAIAANKVPGARAITAHDVTSARLGVEHNHANVLCLGARLTGETVALEAVRAFLDATPSDGRHARRVEKLDAVEANELQQKG